MPVTKRMKHKDQNGIITDYDLGAKAVNVSMADGRNVEDAISNMSGGSGGQNASGGFEGGQSASAGTGGALGKEATVTEGGAIGLNATTMEGAAIGSYAMSSSGGAVGWSSQASMGGAVGESSMSQHGGAVGYGAKTTDGFAGGINAVASDLNGNGIDAIQLGTGTNNTAKTMQVYTKRIVEADGSLTDVGNLSTLETTARTSVVAAANELKSDIIDIKVAVGFNDKDIYGVEVDFVNHKFTRLAGAVGRTSGAGFNDLSIYSSRKRCIVANDGTLLANYGESGYTETGKLTTSIYKNNKTYAVGTPAQVMVKQPKFYYKVVPVRMDRNTSGTGYHLRKVRYYISQTAKTGFKLHPAFQLNGKTLDAVYMAAFESCLCNPASGNYLVNNQHDRDTSSYYLSSIAGALPATGWSDNPMTRAWFRQNAYNRGTGWQQSCIQTVAATQLLFLIEYNSFNMQDKIGRGNAVDTYGAANRTGMSSFLGSNTGAGTGYMTYRGEENFYGNVWSFVDGININTPDNSLYVSDRSFADDQTSGYYKNTGFTEACANGYISAFGYGSEEFDWLFIPSETFGTSALPVGDGYHSDCGGYYMTCAILGGSYSGGTYAGGFYWNTDHPSDYYFHQIGGRLIYIP